MRILVLDTIHGGADLAAALRDAGHRVDEVDVYRGEVGIPVEEALTGLRSRHRTGPPRPDPRFCEHGPAVSHHEVVGLSSPAARGGRSSRSQGRGEGHHRPRHRR